jgi:LacI family transcriptional regulator
MKKVTLKTIAKELDVSISTVSKSLKDSPEISEDTRQKVQAFARLYNYKPNTIALSLKNQRTKTLGVIVPEIVHHFFTTVISGVEKVANRYGYTVIIGLSDESFEKEVTNMDKLANGSIDGFIISVASQTLKMGDFHHINECINQGMPVVMFDRSVASINCDKVIVDDLEGAYTAVSRLIELGCRNIALVSTVDHVDVGKLRTEGYLKALNHHGLKVSPSLILKTEEDISNETGDANLREQIVQLLQSNPGVDGVFAVNEKYALIAMQALREIGKAVPADTRVIGFTDGVLSRYATPSLSTVSQHGLLIGERAAELLIQRLENDEDDRPSQTVVVPTKLIERESTAG